MFAAAPTPPSLEVATASFFHRHCNQQQQLFRSQYKRSNRTKGLKILRCFPHCCPEHIDRGYCGTSLSVSVELESRQPGARPTDEPPSEALAVYARFEAVDDDSIGPGEYMEAAKVDLGTQSEANLGGQWLAGTLETQSELSPTTHSRQHPDKEKRLIFHLNNKPASLWYYSWESGTNKAQRSMKHVLKAYILGRCAVDREDNLVPSTSHCANTQLYHVLHVVTSPRFTLISYRRALPKPDTRTSSHWAVPKDDVAELAGSTEYGLDSINDSHSHWRATGRAHLNSWMATASETTDRERSSSQTSERPAHCEYSTETSELFEEHIGWESMDSATLSMSRNLALVHSFLCWVPLRAYAPFVEELALILDLKLQESVGDGCGNAGGRNCFTRLLFNQAKVEKDRGRIPTELEALLRVLTQATLCLFSAETLAWLRAFFRQYAGSALDKHALHDCFVLFVRELHEQVNAQVFARTELQSLDNVAEAIIAAVYSNESFHAHRPQVRAILNGQRFAGWTAFVAQMREVYINVSVCQKAQVTTTHGPGMRFALAHPAGNSIEKVWNGEWLLDVNEASWKSSEQAITSQGSGYSNSETNGVTGGGISLLTIFQVTSQIVRLEIALDVQTRTLYIRSTQGVAGPLDCMCVVLDGKDRVFSQFPNGMASCIDAGAHGDYVGEITAGQSDKLVVHLQVFEWSVRGDGLSYSMHMSIECEGSRLLCVSGDVLATTATASLTAQDTSVFREMSLREKREAVTNAHARKVEESHTIGWDTLGGTGPWEERGKFQLSYSKL